MATLDDIDDVSVNTISSLLLNDLRQMGWTEHLTPDAEAARRVQEEDLDDAKSEEGVGGQGVPTDTFICAACKTDFPAMEVYISPCGHPYCSECLYSLFQSAVGDTSTYPPKCCGHVFPIQVFRQLLSGPQLVDLEARVRKQKNRSSELADSHPIYCHDKACSTYIETSDRYDWNSIAICPSCRRPTCLKCKASIHKERECPADEETRVLLKTACGQGWKECPGCSQMVSRSVGCNHMECRCKTEFCYNCGVKYIPDPDVPPDEPVGFKAACSCPLFNAPIEDSEEEEEQHEEDEREEGED